MATIFVTFSVLVSRGPKDHADKQKRKSSSQSCSHRNSVQNGPIDKFPAFHDHLSVCVSALFARLELLPDCQVRNYCGGCQVGIIARLPGWGCQVGARFLTTTQIEAHFSSFGDFLFGIVSKSVRVF